MKQRNALRRAQQTEELNERIIYVSDFGGNSRVRLSCALIDIFDVQY